MGVIQTVFRTITCNGPKCAKTITYDVAKEKETFETPENVWMMGLRSLQTLDNRAFSYCTDTCEAEGVATGQHNKLEPKKIIEAGSTSSAQIKEAAAIAAATEAAGKALKAGQPVSGLVTP